ncbi:BolA family transcriptional regulator [Acetobacter sp. AN02]|nr:BolA family transcriptional regulator [Acetobacter sp. AN02]MDG6094639.1 BolA family transcriptional regulator [Acetobacter sp. AN02]
MNRQLTEHLKPQSVTIKDDSARHAHHAPMTRGPDAGASETHFNMTIVSPAFEGMTRIARSKMVHALLAEEFATGLHALSLTLRTPEEAARG